MTATPQVARRSNRTPDRVAAALAGGFIVLLLATEIVLTLPDETDGANVVARFYASHRAFIIILQVLGFVAAVLLGAYAWRLRRVDQVVSVAGIVMAVCALAPGLITVVIAIVADPNDPTPAGRWNLLEPRGDDVLFVGIVVFAAAVALRLGRSLPVLGVLAVLVAIACLTRLVLEAAGASGGSLDAIGPLLFLALVAVLAVSSFLGVLRGGSRHQPS